jgi:hypothetical protein
MATAESRERSLAKDLSRKAAIQTMRTIIPGDDDEFVDPHLKNYPVPLVAGRFESSKDDVCWSRVW